MNIADGLRKAAAKAKADDDDYGWVIPAMVAMFIIGVVTGMVLF